MYKVELKEQFKFRMLALIPGGENGYHIDFGGKLFCFSF